MMIKKVSTGILVGILLMVMLSTIAFATDVTLTLSAQSGLPGDSIEISGTYDSNDWVTVKILDSDGNLVFLKPVRVQDDGTYHTTFIVPDMDAGTLRITAGSGSDVGNADFTVKKKPTPTAAPTSTPKPTVMPSSSPTSTPKPTAASSPTPTFTSKPTATPAAVPTATNGEQENTPDTGDDAQTIVPIQAQENEEAGTLTIEIDVSDLPEGTAAVRLPNGEVVKLDGSDTLRIEINKSNIRDDGSLLLIALDDEGTPLGEYAVQLEQFKTQDTGSAGGGIWPVLMWILIGIAGVGAITLVVYVVAKKRRA